MGRGLILLRIEMCLLSNPLNRASPIPLKRGGSFTTCISHQLLVPRSQEAPCVSHCSGLSGTRRAREEGRADKSHTERQQARGLHQVPRTTVLHLGEDDIRLDNSTADHLSTKKEIDSSAKKLLSL